MGCTQSSSPRPRLKEKRANKTIGAEQSPSKVPHQVGDITEGSYTNTTVSFSNNSSQDVCKVRVYVPVWINEKGCYTDVSKHADVFSVHDSHTLCLARLVRHFFPRV
jgi:hypothetical protein